MSLSLLSCGYRWHDPCVEGNLPKVHIAFIKKDPEGILMREIARAFSLSGVAAPTYDKGDYRLEIAFLKEEIEPLGYRFAREKISGEVSQNLVLSENRRSIHLAVTFFEGESEKIAFGPFDISADLGYDFLASDSFQDLTFMPLNGGLTTVLPFSLGQLEPQDAAFEATTDPLCRQLARKIVDAFVSNW